MQMKVGIVGTNFISDRFVESAKLVDGLQVSSVCSGHYENALKFQKKHEIATVYQDFNEMIHANEMDVIYLAIPNSLHQSFAMDCISTCTNVIVEKPFAPNARNAKAMFQYANSMNTYIHDAIVPLYTKNFEILKNNLYRVGKIRRAIFSFSKYSSRYDAYLANENPTTFRKELCNGCWMDLGIYVIADAVALFGKPNHIMASSIMLDSGVDGADSAIFQYDGFDAVILASKITDTKIVNEIEGEDGTLLIEQASLISKITFIDRKTKKEEVISIESKNPFAEQLMDFMESMEGGYSESKRVPHALTMQIIETMEECRRQSNVLYKGEEL